MHVLITGASKGIGLATALRLVSSRSGSLRLSLCSRHEREMVPLRDRLNELSDTAEILTKKCDVSDAHDVEELVTRAEQSFGSIDVLVNNAGFGIFETAQDMTLDQFDRVIGTNLRGVFLMTKAVSHRMMIRKAGTIVTVNSIAGKIGYPKGGSYCASKFGAKGLMDSLAIEAREHNIRVINVHPGNVNTGFFRSAGYEVDTSRYLRAEDVAEIIYQAIMLPSTARVSEIEIRPLTERTK